MSQVPVSSLNTEDRILSGLLAFAELMKPELTGLSVLTALFGYYVSAVDGGTFIGYLVLTFGTLLVGGGAGALNQWIERDLDLMMKRTEKRPLPSGRLQGKQALAFGVVITILGNVLLTAGFGLLTGLLGVLTSALYLFVYTPLKRKSWHNTTVGAIPGALPVLIGCSAAGGSFTLSSWLLFAIVFVWQFPHFLSLAWLYRKDYARAGFQMLSVIDTDDSRRTSSLNLLLSLSLFGLSWGLASTGQYGSIFLAGAIISNVVLTGAALLAHRASRRKPVELPNINRSARMLFFASLLYLPVLMGGAVFDSIH